MRSLWAVLWRIPIKLPHLFLYIDDIIFFMHASKKNINRLHDMLVAYGDISNQMYNHVSYRSSLHRATRHYIRQTTSIVEGSLPFTNLGVPIFRGMPKMEHLIGMADSVISKFNRCMEGSYVIISWGNWIWELLSLNSQHYYLESNFGKVAHTRCITEDSNHSFMLQLG